MAGRAPKRSLAAPGARFAVLVARFNEAISKRLLDGALAAFAEHGVPPDAVETHWVPGSFELPQAALALARTRRYAGIVCVGVVIKGETPHFEYVSSAAAHGITQAALATGVPVSFGVVTALTEAQAVDRAGGAVANRGEEAALAALEMAGWMQAVRGGSGALPGRAVARAPGRSPR